MSTELSQADRLPVVAAFLAPVVGLPLLGPWVVYAILPDDSPAKPHVARAFDLHLGTIVAGVVLLGLGTLSIGYEAASVMVGVLLVLMLIADVVLLVGILRGDRWSAPWRPVVLSRRKFYHQAPFAG